MVKIMVLYILIFTISNTINIIFPLSVHILCDLVLPLSVSSTLLFPCGHPVAAYVFLI